MTYSEPNLSEPEIMVMVWLTKRKIPFQMQVNFFGGVSERGGAKVDFVLPELLIILRVQSYWHTIPPALARDELQKIQLINAGYQVVDVFEDDLRENLENTMSKAIKGIEVHNN